LPDPVLTSSFPTGSARFSTIAVPHNLRRGFILSCASSLFRVSRATSACSLPAASTFLGVSFPIATFTVGVHHAPVSFEDRRAAGVPSLLRSALDVSHVLDGLLHRRLCGFVSPHSHVRDSLSRGFPPHGAVRACRSPVPSCRWHKLPVAGCPDTPETYARLQGLALRVDPL